MSRCVCVYTLCVRWAASSWCVRGYVLLLRRVILVICRRLLCCVMYCVCLTTQTTNCACYVCGVYVCGYVHCVFAVFVILYVGALALVVSCCIIFVTRRLLGLGYALVTMY